MILANRNGLLIATTLLRVTDKHYVLQHADCQRPTKVPIDDTRKRLFTNTDAALEWIDEGRV